jgi:hypothetical protein
MCGMLLRKPVGMKALGALRCAYDDAIEMDLN